MVIMISLITTKIIVVKYNYNICRHNERMISHNNDHEEGNQKKQLLWYLELSGYKHIRAYPYI